MSPTAPRVVSRCSRLQAASGARSGQQPTGARVEGQVSSNSATRRRRQAAGGRQSASPASSEHAAGWMGSSWRKNSRPQSSQACTPVTAARSLRCTRAWQASQLPNKAARLGIAEGREEGEADLDLERSRGGRGVAGLQAEAEAHTCRRRGRRPCAACRPRRARPPLACLRCSAPQWPVPRTGVARLPAPVAPCSLTRTPSRRHHRDLLRSPSHRPSHPRPA